MKILFALGAVIATFFFLKNLFFIVFSMENYTIHKKRLKQLNFDEKKEDMSANELIDRITKPIIRHVLSRFNMKNLEQLERDLRMAKWNKFFNPLQYRALNLLLKVLGVVFFILFYQSSLLIAGIWAFALLFMMDILFKNSVVNRRERIFNDFPDFIRIVEGYLTANMPFAKAVEESIKYVGDEWKPILKNFVVEAEMKSIHEALDYLKQEIDLFEMREFISIVKLTLEQGGDAKDSFSVQADKIRQLQLDLIQIKIGKRESMGALMQAPLLLTLIVVFGLPTVDAMMSFSSM